MIYEDEIDYGLEIRGRVCPECGGSLVRRKGKPHCDEHGRVRPAPEPRLKVLGG